MRRNGHEIGVSLRVAGGLSTDPHLAKGLDAFILPNQVVPVLKGIASIFRDSDVLRENRERARLKFLFLKHGWTAEHFPAELNGRLGFDLAPAVPEDVPDDVYRDHGECTGRSHPATATWELRFCEAGFRLLSYILRLICPNATPVANYVLRTCRTC